MENNSVLSKYYEGILNQLRGEVDFINELFTHQGVKGEGNEAAIRNLITKFVPKKFEIGSGVVIDHNGIPSRQCDIVIYDNTNYPEILSLTSVHLFPVDTVYATIEIKTALDAKSSSLAIENIKSVRGLEYIKDEFRTWPTDPVTELTGNTALWGVASTTPPIGIVFSYRSNTSNFETFTNWFRSKADEETEHWPSHIFCLDQGLIVAPGWSKRKSYLCALASEKGFYIESNDEIKIINDKEWVNLENRPFPLTKYKDKKYLVDQSKLLLNFVLILAEVLNKKQFSPRISFRENYLTQELKSMLPIEE